MTYQILNGDALAMLRTLPDESVHCCVTSPPYWGLRDYGTGDAQIGLEDTPGAYVARLVAVFDELRRVLRSDGTLWLNLGDSYANTGMSDTSKVGGFTGERIRRNAKGIMDSRPRAIPDGLKPKDLVGIPWRVAFALQAAGWWLRSDIVWAKGLSFCPTYAGSAMPESVTDRPTKGHEYLFLLTKSERYFYDIEAVKENAVGAEPGNVTHKGVTAYSNGDGHHRTKAGLINMGASTRRNLRTVWAINPGSYPEAHFATFPPALVEPCVLAGTSAHGVCPACGAPWVRVVERGEPVARPDNPNAVMPYGAASGHTNGQGATTLHKLRTVETTGWQPSCNCDAGEPIPATVLDPFAGSGTTLAVAVEHKRSGIGIELNPAYVDLIHKRLGTVQPRLFNL